MHYWLLGLPILCSSIGTLLLTVVMIMRQKPNIRSSPSPHHGWNKKTDLVNAAER